MGLSLLFSAVFSAISIIFDRQIGFFKAVLVAPVPRSAIAIGKIVAGALQALAQGLILLPFAPLAGASLGPFQVAEMIGAMALASLTFSAIGVSFACRFTSTTVFPFVSNAVLLPMFFLSGGLYPLEAAPRWMQVTAHLDPVAYAVDLMRGAVTGRFFFPVPLSLAALAATIGLLAWAAVRVFNRGEDDSSLGEAGFVWRR
jgi:ABC-2 type transport system permease protein